MPALCDLAKRRIRGLLFDSAIRGATPRPGNSPRLSALGGYSHACTSKSGLNGPRGGAFLVRLHPVGPSQRENRPARGRSEVFRNLFAVGPAVMDWKKMPIRPHASRCTERRRRSLRSAMKQQKEILHPTYSRHEVHEVVTSQGLVVITDRERLAIKIRADAEDPSSVEAEYIDRDWADDYCSHDPSETFQAGFEEGGDEPTTIHEDVALLLKKEIGDWHDQVHDGPSVNCYEDPCRPLLSALEDARVLLRL